MDSTPVSKESTVLSGSTSQSGIALFMVIASISVLAILVTEFTYIANISQSIAFGGLDQLKAHYVAKSGLKLSLLRLKAYTKAKDMLKSSGANAMIPQSIMEKIWSFPFLYPIPTNIPGLGANDKAAIETFQKESGMEGSYTAAITSESSRYNVNMIVPGMAPTPTPTSSPSPPPPGSTAPLPQTPSAPLTPQAARDSLEKYIGTILNQKFETDPDFATHYRDFRLPDFIDTLAAWADRTYERRTSPSRDPVPMKKAPFYSISELHMLPSMDEELYDLLAQNLTATTTSGVNINTIQETALRSLIPQMGKDEVTEFFKFRDSQEADNLFASVEKFYEYLQKSVAAFKSNPQALNDLKADLASRNIILVKDETQFKITVRAQVNHAVRVIEAWVTVGPQEMPAGRPDPGLKITHMRVL